MKKDGQSSEPYTKSESFDVKSPRTVSKSKQAASAINPRLAMVVIVVMAVLTMIYVATGVDPLGLFTGSAAAPTPTLDVIVPPTEFPTPLPNARPTATRVPSGDTTGSGDWWEVYFTDPASINDPTNIKGSIEEKLIGYINEAQETIDIAAFEFNLTPVADALISASRRGVRVRWMTDDEHGIEADSEEGRGQFAMLKKAKIEVKDDDRSALMHHKFWVFDGRIVWTGSTNITSNGMFRNNNNVIVFRSPELAAVYTQQFEEMWAGQFTSRSPSDVAAQTVTIARTPVQVLFSPEDDAIDQIIPFIEQAQSSIVFMAFSFTHDDLAKAMLERAKAGVTVTGIFETRGSETEYSELGPFFCAGLAVRQDGNPGTFHHKVIIIDERIIITGSLNFSANADESNSENSVILPSKTIAALYLREFNRRWAEGTVPSTGSITCK